MTGLHLSRLMGRVPLSWKAYDHCLHEEERDYTMTMPSADNVSSEEDVCNFPASFAQQRLWFLDQLEPNTATYNLTSAVLISIPLDLEALEQSLYALVQRHAVLRTIFGVKDEQLMQVISPTLNVPLLVVDVQSLPASQREPKVRQMLTEEAQRPFDLARGPLLRTTLLQLDGQESLLLLSSHHLVFDDWSIEVFFREWVTLYEAFRNDQPSSLPDLPLQYADFARWQREKLTGERLAECLDYWKQQLEGAPSVLKLPTAHPHPPMPTHRCSIHPFVLSQHLRDALEALSLQEGVSLFMMMIAAFQTLLHRYTGQDDFMIGTMISERTRPQFQGLIGGFLNPLVLRTNLSGNPTFRELVGRVCEVTHEAYAHQDIPFEYLVKELQPEQSLGRNPFFQVLLTIHPSMPILPAGWAFSQMNIETGAAPAPFDLSLELDEGLEVFTGRFKYNIDLFDAATIARMERHWQTLLEGIVAAPDQRIAKLPLLSEAEWHQQVVEWNATETDYPQNQCFHELFEAQVERTPEAVAVVFEQEQLTYRELNQHANQLAHHLQKLGVAPETLVALLLERGIHFVVAILAVFKAGGAFLPLDPEHPVKRHYEILKQSHCHYVLATDKYGTALTKALVEFAVGQRPQVIHIESLFQKDQAKENLPPRSKPGNLAYVMYTSGSTGVPKGVMVEQAGMVNHIYAKIADLGLSMEDRVAQNSPPCFDIVVWQCLAALLLGGCVHIFKDETAHDPLQLLRQVDEQKITIVEMVPSLLRAVVQQAEMLGKARPRLRDLRWVVPTGDALSPELCRQWLQLYPAIPMLNNCGSTECSDDNCHYAIYQPPPSDYPLSMMPIGRPIQNIRAYILDRQLMPVPIGVVGDLYIGGIGVGRGYLHDAERTAKVFLPDPFSRKSGARLYKTGDLARYLPDGTLVFLGRSDHLVKIRGNRIELGEIEMVLRQHPAVQEVVVLAREDVPGKIYLVAYVVLHEKQAATIGDLQSHGLKNLPNYMLPSAFVLLEALPLTINGKIDRRALPVPNQERPALQSAFVEARTPLEETITAIWSQVLEIEQVGIHDNFLALGGHSLLAMQIMARLQTTLHTEVPLRSLFEAPTVAQLAEAISHLQTQQGTSNLPAPGAYSREAYHVQISSAPVVQESGQG
jgi:amino acid adenylation domain-containing protein